MPLATSIIADYPSQLKNRSGHYQKNHCPKTHHGLSNHPHSHRAEPIPFRPVAQNMRYQWPAPGTVGQDHNTVARFRDNMKMGHPSVPLSSPEHSFLLVWQYFYEMTQSIVISNE